MSLGWSFIVNNICGYDQTADSMVAAAPLLSHVIFRLQS